MGIMVKSILKNRNKTNAINVSVQEKNGNGNNEWCGKY